MISSAITRLRLFLVNVLLYLSNIVLPAGIYAHYFATSNLEEIEKIHNFMLRSGIVTFEDLED